MFVIIGFIRKNINTHLEKYMKEEFKTLGEPLWEVNDDGVIYDEIFYEWKDIDDVKLTNETTDLFEAGIIDMISGGETISLVYTYKNRERALKALEFIKNSIQKNIVDEYKDEEEPQDIVDNYHHKKEFTTVSRPNKFSVSINNDKPAMKKIQCESCGGNDFLYDNGFLVCKSCGTRYIVSGIESSNKGNNLLILARRSKEEKDYKKAISFYEKLLLKDPNNYEAEYNIRLCDMLMAKPRFVESKLEKLVGSFPLIAKLISYITDPLERKNAIVSITNELTGISKDCYSNSLKRTFLSEDEDDNYDLYSRLDDYTNLQLYSAFINQKWPDALIKNIYENDEIDENENLDYVEHIIIDSYKLFVNMLLGIKDRLADEEKADEWIAKTLEVINKLDPAFEPKAYMTKKE